MGEWETAHGATVPSSGELDSNFKIRAPPNTDIWRRNASDDVFNAPVLYQRMKASAFKSLTATIFAPWRTQYDQGGIILVFQPPASDPQRPVKWVKAGIEFFDDEPALGVVGTDRCSDWSLAPMSAGHQQKATFQAVREGDTLWVHARQEGVGELRPMREIKWAFVEEGEGQNDESEMWVGVYAAKPKQDEDDAEETKGIEVTFSGLKIKSN